MMKLICWKWTHTMNLIQTLIWTMKKTIGREKKEKRLVAGDALTRQAPQAGARGPDVAEKKQLGTVLNQHQVIPTNLMLANA
ncbi:unnamed protein product [Acanthoscelides obtectus]|uniref:Uncharacterized protein n=1 Tax=Acanthoscelides obtectus TaxID=200917 RepID=A0A9P0LLT1_ACAOB|nr:unnamed protein product [Acanthoscelides obtectus]CAK1624282.1 hypothetical protein AOBTE_LOCUS2468 [Acanthoscelides obtectus]